MSRAACCAFELLVFTSCRLCCLHSVGQLTPKRGWVQRFTASAFKALASEESRGEAARAFRQGVEGEAMRTGENVQSRGAEEERNSWRLPARCPTADSERHGSNRAGLPASLAPLCRVEQQGERHAAVHAAAPHRHVPKLLKRQLVVVGLGVAAAGGRARQRRQLSGGARRAEGRPAAQQATGSAAQGRRLEQAHQGIAGCRLPAGGRGSGCLGLGRELLRRVMPT